MLTRSLVKILVPLLAGTLPLCAVDLYGGSSTAQSTALGGLFTGSDAGPTDMLSMNPAQLTSLRGPAVELSGLAVFAGGSYRNQTGIPGGLQTSSGFAPSAAFGTAIGHSRWSVGAGILPTSMLSDSWRFVDPVGAGGASYGLQTNKSEFVALQTTFGVAYRVSKKLSLGADLGVLYNRNRLASPYIFQNNALTGLKTLLDLRTSGVGYNGTFGITYQADPKWELGASYKTRTTVRSTGDAKGNASTQFGVLGLPFQPDFHYNAEVDNIFPQSASLFLTWHAQSKLALHGQGDWVNWRSAFVNLPVRLTAGTNPDINSLLGSNTLNDSIPLRWRNQYHVRAGVEYKLTERTELLAGYAHSNNPVPASTLTPLTANIMRDALSTGLAYNPGRYRFALAYQVNLPTSETTGKSLVQSGEFDNATTHLWLQSVVLTTGFRW